MKLNKKDKTYAIISTIIIFILIGSHYVLNYLFSTFPVALQKAVEPLRNISDFFYIIAIFLGCCVILFVLSIKFHPEERIKEEETVK